MKYLFLPFLFISAIAFSQGNGKIYYRNGKIFEGKIVINKPVSTGEGITKIHHFPTEDTKLTDGFNEIYRVDKYNYNKTKDTITYYFKKYKNKELFLTKLHSYKNFEIFEGTVLRSTEFTPGFGLPSTQNSWFENVYYLGRKTGYKLEKLHKRMPSKKFKTLLLKYTDKCTNVVSIIEKYQKIKKSKKRELFEELKNSCD